MAGDHVRFVGYVRDKIESFRIIYVTPEFHFVQSAYSALYRYLKRENLADDDRYLLKVIRVDRK